MRLETIADYTWGDLRVRFVRDAARRERVGLWLMPESRSAGVVAPRAELAGEAIDGLPASWHPLPTGEVEPLVQLHVRGDALAGGFSAGRSLRAGESVARLRWVAHAARTGRAEEPGCETQLRDDRGLEVTHRLCACGDSGALRVETQVTNRGESPLTLELLSSFTLGGLTPFAARDEPGRLVVHRFRSAWSAEGRHEARTLEELNLERSWSGHGWRIEAFGQAGSLPVNGFFPLVGVEDRGAGVTWAAQLFAPGAWQLELARRGDHVALSGGLADRDRGHWWKTLAPGETFNAPVALLTAVAGTIDEACDRLLQARRTLRPAPPAPERTLPIVFNEWCTSWGHPTHANVLALADRLRGSGVRYLVIDDGWAERAGEGIQQNGDWDVNRRAFPEGLRAFADAVRARGLIPGLWFEFEVVNPGSRAWSEEAHQLRRAGHLLQVGTRRFWDFRDPWVHAFLAAKVIGLLRKSGLGYLKIDYNDSIGAGCDGAESPGEGLRQHLEGVQAFLARIRAELPELVIENCSSGGHRLEPSFMALTAMSSFSDAHETPDIPVIAANLLRLAPPEQTQIWCVLRARDSRRRLSYSLAAAFLGRMCLSGEVTALEEPAWAFVRAALTQYAALAPLLAAGRWRVFADRGDAYQHLTGSQAARCLDEVVGRGFVVWHAFADTPAELRIPLPRGESWRVTDELAAEPTEARIDGAMLQWRVAAPWTGGVIVLERGPRPRDREASA
jgi:alpha-galactosidase